MNVSDGIGPGFDSPTAWSGVGGEVEGLGRSRERQGREERSRRNQSHEAVLKSEAETRLERIHEG